jgi:hypothetical protein
VVPLPSHLDDLPMLSRQYQRRDIFQEIDKLRSVSLSVNSPCPPALDRRRSIRRLSASLRHGAGCY